MQETAIVKPHYFYPNQKVKERMKVWWSTPVIPALRKRRQENQQFKATLSYPGN